MSHKQRIFKEVCNHPHFLRLLCIITIFCMKKSITKSLRKALGVGLAAFLMFSAGTASAQWCGGTSSWGNGTLYGGNVTSIDISNANGTLAAYSTLGNNTTPTLLNAGNAFDITAGEELTITLEGNSDQYSYGWNTHVGIWIDADLDGKFDGITECVADPQTGPFLDLKPGQPKTAKIKVPCGKVGNSRMRITGANSYYANAYGFSKNCGCNTGTCYYHYGNSFDLDVKMKIGNPPVASFDAPTGPNYEKANITFNANNPNSYYVYRWNFNPPGTAGSGTPASAIGAKTKSKWNAPGTYDVKLVADYCGLRDSITKSVKVIAPTSAPLANFIASSNLVEIYYDVTFYDLSTNGAWKWAWELTSPTGNLYTSSQQNPTFNLDEQGKWSVCLTSENGVGPSSKICKSKYVECTPPSEFYLGPNKLGTNKKGTLYDNGGPTLPYGNNRKVTIDYFKILPCGAKEIRLSFKQLKLADANDQLRIYDGTDESGKLLTPSNGINGSNQGTYRNTVFKALSGAMYITFQSNASGVDSGFIATWDSDLLPPVAPKVTWTTPYNPAANGMDVTFTSVTSNAQGNVDYEWIVDGNPYMGFNPEFTTVFTTDGSYQVCVVATTCNGADTGCKSITIITPTKPGSLDFVASNLRPKLGETVQLTTNTDFANAFEWSIFPLTYKWVVGNQNSRNPQIKFEAGGAYTFTLKAWNTVGGQTATEKKLIKNKYVIALDYCTPPVDLLSSDVGINQVKLSKGGTDLINHETTSGAFAYTDYTETVKATLTYGASYDLAVSRKTNSNPVNFKAWIDFNIDGDFNDPGEEILTTGSINGTDGMATFTVPPLSQSFEGQTRMRVAASYGNFTNNPCGVNIVGEFEDYRIILANDKLPPFITLVGSDTVRVEKGSTANSCYAEVAGVTYSASDPTEGNLTNKVSVVTDLDCTVPGIYTFEFNVKDASGNAAPTRRRTVIVVLDRTPPVLTLNGTSPMTVEQCDKFVDPGAIAIDGVDGDLTTAIITSGSVNTNVVGDYTITYTIKDAQGNTASISRVVKVVDTKKPGIYLRGVRIANNSTVNVQINSVFVDDVYAEDHCNGIININKQPGFNGPVNTIARATYPISYFSEDPSGNKADEDGYVINYKVDDFIAPNIVLNTEDTVIHDVNFAYVSRPVTVTDNYYPISKVSVVKTGTVDPYTLGTYVETFTATDESGNVAVKKRYVKIVDREAPAILAPAVNVCVGTPFWAYSGVIITDNYYSPATLMPLVKVLNHNVNIWQSGVYFVNYELTDPSGNKALLVTRSVFVTYPPNCQNTYTGVENIKLSDAVTVYPNPTKGTVNIGYTLGNNAPLNVDVFNAVGVKVAEAKGLKGGFGLHQIDLSNFGSGTYMIRMTNNGESITRTVVVSK